MNTTEIIWYWFSNIVVGGIGFSTLIIVIAKFFGVNLLKLWFAKDLEKYKSELDAKNKEIQAQLDTKIELLKIQYSNVFSDRIEIFKNESIRIFRIEKQVSEIQAFKNNYKCYTIIDFNKACNTKSPCEECILNYRDKIIKLQDDCRQEYYYFQENSMFFSIEMIGKSAEIMTPIIEACGSALKVEYDDANRKAREMIDIICDIDIAQLSKLREDLNSMFRLIIGISYYENLEDKIRMKYR